MPTEAWIAAASQTDRRPVLLMSVESVNAVTKQISTKAQWDASPAKTNVNTASLVDTSGIVILSTDTEDGDPLADHAGEYTGLQTNSSTTHRNTHKIAAVLRVNTTTAVYNADFDKYFYSYNTLSIEVWADDENGTATKIANAYDCYNGPHTEDQYYTIPGILIPDGVYSNIRPVVVNSVVTLTGRSAAPWSPDVSVTVAGHIDTFQIYYETSGSIKTPPIDMESVPADVSVLNIEDTIKAGTAISYAAWGSNNIYDWTSLGTVSDGSTLASYRYYFVEATMTSTGANTPEIASIGVSGGDTSYLRFSTHENVPVFGAKPYLAMDIGTLTSKLELMKLGTIGEVSPKLVYLKETFNLIRDGYLRNKAVCLKYGFLGLPETDYLPIFTGLWYDYTLDLYRQSVAVKTRTILSRFQKVQLPKEIATGSTRNDTTCPVIEWINANIIDVMLEVIDTMGIQERYIDRASFNAISAGSRSGADWNVSRRLDKDCKEDALKLLEELSVLSGVFILQLPNGKLVAKLYDASEPTVREITADIATFGTVDGGQADLFTRQQICYGQKHVDDLTDGTARGAWAAGVDIAKNDSATVSSVTWYCIQSHKSATDNAPGTGTNYRAFWATEWTARAFLAGEVCLHNGPLYTCSIAHTGTSTNEPGQGTGWRGVWTTKPVKDGSSASDFYNAYTLINEAAEVHWGINKDVPEGDPDYLSDSGPGYQKTVLDKWNISANARVALAARLDSWFANPKMKMKASDIPPSYFAGTSDEEIFGSMVGITGLNLPVSGAEWGDLCENKKFFVTGKTLDPKKCTISLELLEV